MLLIGIAGGTGSGKTTVVNQIVEALNPNRVTLISQDDYYNETSHLSYDERCKINFDHPSAIDFDLLIKHVKKLKDGKSINKPVYSFKNHNRSTETVLTSPEKVIIVEGILVFTNRELRKLMDIKLFVYADSDERLIRRLRRDIRERGRDFDEVISRYQETLKPMHDQFIEPSKSYADIIIPHDDYNSVAINIVKTVIQEALKNEAK
ncbi:uridine kinase [Namhaeicola litoreus]|uniref:Uridine kinase n=1 Tax=Namhaeicola litoreus TaxID=1052145 RepID=A0ABW3Y5X7_9FLAO